MQEDAAGKKLFAQTTTQKKIVHLEKFPPPPPPEKKWSVPKGPIVYYVARAGGGGVRGDYKFPQSFKSGGIFFMHKKNGGWYIFLLRFTKWSDEVWLCLFYVSHKNRILRT